MITMLVINQFLLEQIEYLVDKEGKKETLHELFHLVSRPI